MYKQGQNHHVLAPRVPCKVEDCADTISAFASSGMCAKHQKAARAKARRGSKRVYNDEGVIVSPCSYMAAHRRVTRTRGPAREYMCVHCMDRADDWAYNNMSPLEQHGVNKAGYPQRWSPDAYDYLPLCKTHHYAYDRIEKPAVHNYIDTGMTVNGMRVLFNERNDSLAIDDGKVPPTEAPDWVRLAYCYI